MLCCHGLKFFIEFPVVKSDKIEYNKINLKCTITPVYFEPTDTLNGIPKSLYGCQAPTRKRIGGEGKSIAAVTHLARLGVRRQEPAFWGYTNDKRAVRMDCSFPTYRKENKGRKQ